MYDLETIHPKYTEEELSKFESSDLFNDAAVELLKNTLHLLWVVIGLRYCDSNGNSTLPLNKEEAVIGGNLVRLLKLNTSFLQNMCESKIEICYILNRCIAETSINILYIINNCEERVIKNYIKYSLITEKDLWNTVMKNIELKNGDIWDVERRMQNSIKNSFEESDFELEDINRSSKWKSIAARAEEIAGEMFYSIYYGVASHSVHGNWQDILINNLKKDENGFLLNFAWDDPRPQMVDGPVYFNLDVIEQFAITELKTNTYYTDVLSKHDMLFEYYKSFSEYHEKFLANNKNSR
ncbi:MAG: DUF5677 domain-containing protein [Saprospiraceae bacterium]|jgi:hypothetical protein